MMSVIVDADSCSYWEQRAIELLQQARLPGVSNIEQEDRLRTAIKLLVLSLAKRSHEQNTEA